MRQMPIGTATAVIASAATTSGAIDTGGTAIGALGFPGAMTGTSVSFTVSTTVGGTFKPLHVNGALYSMPATQGTVCHLPREIFANFRYVKIVSNDTEAAERTIDVFIREV